MAIRNGSQTHCARSTNHQKTTLFTAAGPLSTTSTRAHRYASTSGNRYPTPCNRSAPRSSNVKPHHPNADDLQTKRANSRGGAAQSAIVNAPLKVSDVYRVQGAIFQLHRHPDVCSIIVAPNAVRSAGIVTKMFNGAIKEEAIMALKTAQASHETEAKVVGEASARLFDLRKSSSEQIIPQIEGYVNSLANSPKDLNKTFSEYRADFKTFNEIVAAIEEEAAKINTRAGAGGATGVAAGLGVAAFAPSAAMAIATTFGVASTGTGISTLSGVAATNAALAWLGGGDRKSVV